MDRSSIISELCSPVEGHAEKARRVIQESYPRADFSYSKRLYTPTECMKVYVRDGFIDRYSGQRLVFPGTLRALSIMLPDEFPFHANWKMNLTHPAFWELFPTIDHVVPVTRGGIDCEENWVTRSQLRNSAKANWTLEELSWELLPAGSINQWDGLTRWFLGLVTRRADLLQNSYLRNWWRAAKACLPEQIA